MITINGIRIAGLSGIYKNQDHYKGHYEIPPFNTHTQHSVYHVRNLEIHRLSQIKMPIDIMLTHDWPTGITNYGNCNELLRIKPYFEEEIQNNSLGSPENEKLLKILKPKYWFAAHLHVKFAALYKHNDNINQTKFLSLDKCLPRRKFLQLIDIQTTVSDNKLCLDPEWLLILKKSDSWLNISSYMQAPLNEKLTITKEEIDDLLEDFESNLTIPNNFRVTAPAHQPNSDTPNLDIKDVYLNDQTTLLCEMLNIRDPVRVLLERTGRSTIISESKTELYNNLLDEDDDDDDEEEESEGKEKEKKE